MIAIPRAIIIIIIIIIITIIITIITIIIIITTTIIIIIITIIRTTRSRYVHLQYSSVVSSLQTKVSFLIARCDIFYLLKVHLRVA